MREVVCGFNVSGAPAADASRTGCVDAASPSAAAPGGNSVGDLAVDAVEDVELVAGGDKVAFFSFIGLAVLPLLLIKSRSINCSQRSFWSTTSLWMYLSARSMLHTSGIVAKVRQCCRTSTGRSSTPFPDAFVAPVDGDDEGFWGAFRASRS